MGALDLKSLLHGAVSDLSWLRDALANQRRSERSWHDIPRLLERHQQKRKKHRRGVKAMRRTRRARGQNLRTGA